MKIRKVMEFWMQPEESSAFNNYTNCRVQQFGENNIPLPNQIHVREVVSLNWEIILNGLDLTENQKTSIRERVEFALLVSYEV